jgi:putative heme-binding domain-containing protein
LKQIEAQLRSTNKDLRLAAHTLARRFGPRAASLGKGLWPAILNPKSKFEDTVENLSTIARIQGTADDLNWKAVLLHHEDPYVRMEAVRWWRIFKGGGNVDLLVDNESHLVEKDKNAREDVAFVIRYLQGKGPEPVDKDALTKYALKELAEMPAVDRPKRAAMGLQVFERNACTRCHTTATQTTLLAPSLKGIAAQKVDYLIESVLYPSKVIKTGFEAEQIELKNGKVLTGLVKDDGKFLRVLSLDKDERIARDEVESRATTKVSVMPDGQEATLSRREFVDLMLYLQTLK